MLKMWLIVVQSVIDKYIVGWGWGGGGCSVKEAGNPLPISDLKELISVFVKKKMLLVCDPLTKTEN